MLFLLFEKKTHRQYAYRTVIVFDQLYIIVNLSYVTPRHQIKRQTY